MIVSPAPAKDAAHLARMIDREVRPEQDSTVAVPSGSDRADCYLRKATWAGDIPKSRWRDCQSAALHAWCLRHRSHRPRTRRLVAPAFAAQTRFASHLRRPVARFWRLSRHSNASKPDFAWRMLRNIAPRPNRLNASLVSED